MSYTIVTMFFVLLSVFNKTSTKRTFYHDELVRSTETRTIYDGITDVTITGCGNIESAFTSFPDAKIVTMNHCDKNFVFAWLQPVVFPKVETIYLNSHPCEPQVFKRFPQAKWYLLEEYKWYKNKWAADYNNVHIKPVTCECRWK